MGHFEKCALGKLTILVAVIPRSRVFLPRVPVAVIPGRFSLLLLGRRQGRMLLLIIALSQFHPRRVTALLIGGGPRLLIVILRHLVRAARGLKGSRVSVNGIVVAAAVAARASRFVLLHLCVLVAATPACRFRRRLAFVAASWKRRK